METLFESDAVSTACLAAELTVRSGSDEPVPDLAATIAKQRRILVRRLVDLLFLPTGQLTRHERALVDETVASLYPRLPVTERARLARRMNELSDPLAHTSLLMAQESIEVALPFLERPELFGPEELVHIIHQTDRDHQIALAGRPNLPSQAVDALLSTQEPDVLHMLLNNHLLAFSRQSLLRAVDLCRRDEHAQALLLTRPDVPADIAHVMFWWVSPEWRLYILQRYAVDRRRIADVVADVQDVPDFDAADIALALRTLGTLRRVPLREGPDTRGLFLRWLDDPGAPTLKSALLEALMIQPETLARISADDGGEPMVVLAKAIGMTPSEFSGVAPALWQSLSLMDPERHASLGTLFATISTDWADLVLRLWDRQSAVQALSSLAVEPPV